MKPLSHFLPPLDWLAIDPLITGRSICIDSRKIKPGDVFFAFPGEHTDGREHIPDALTRGAAAVLWDTEANFEWSPEYEKRGKHIPNLGITHLRHQTGIIASHIFGNPSKQLKITGVTGTNGKTSVAHWLAQAFTLLGQSCGFMGTIGNGFPSVLEKASLTTLDPLVIQAWLNHFQKQGAHRIAMEVSSHGLAQGRVYGTLFDTAVWTNLTRDHLDYHGTMMAYGREKAKLFDWEGLRVAVINHDDEWGRQLLGRIHCPLVLSYGLDAADVCATYLETSLAGIEMEVKTPMGSGHLTSSLLGRFNASNLLACLSVLLANDIPLESALAILAQIKAAPGRMQTLGGGEAEPLIIIDYAHTPDALEKALRAIREWMPIQSKLFCLFGCGGNRDPGKRSWMGKVAAELADHLFITSDNPRDEDPQDIIQDIIAGISQASTPAGYFIEPDRQRAIESIVQHATEHDIILIAGKGHEENQEIKGTYLPFNDLVETNRALAIKRKKIC